MKYQASFLCKLLLACSADFSGAKGPGISALVNNLTSWQVDILQQG
jgi:hypothetical protein